MTPEAKARHRIDDKLARAGWTVQDFRQLDLGAARGVAVREYPTDTGPADYVLFVDRQAVGVVEAKRDEAGLVLLLDLGLIQIGYEARLDEWLASGKETNHLIDLALR